MKYTIEGFSQKHLIQMGLDAIDAVILRWIIDFYNTDKMNKIFINNREYFWINYKTIIDQLPIIRIKGKKAISMRLDKFVKCGLFYKYVEQNNRTYFAINNDRYTILISEIKKKNSDKKENSQGDKDGGVESEFQGGRNLNSKGGRIESPSIDYSINNSSSNKKNPAEGKPSTPSLTAKGKYTKEDMELAEYFLSTHNDRMKNKYKKDLMKWAKTINECVRLDGYSRDRIKEIITHFRGIVFWRKNFMSPLKLRRKNEDGIKYIDFFDARLEEDKNKSEKNRREEIIDEEARRMGFDI